MLVLVESGGGASLKTGVFAGKSLKGTLVPVGDSDLNERKKKNHEFFSYCYHRTPKQESQLKS